MAKSLVLPLAEFVNATYLIPSATPQTDAPGLALEAAAASPQSSRLEDELERGTLTLHVRAASDTPEPPIDTLIANGADPQHIRQLAIASHFVVIHMPGRAGFPATHEWAARLLAAEVAGKLDAPVLDPAIPLLMSSRQAGAMDHRGGMRVRDWVFVGASLESPGLRLSTRGMSRFGFPDFSAQAVPPRLAHESSGVMLAMAAALLNRAQTALDYDPLANCVQVPTLFALGPGRAAVVRLERGEGTLLHLTPAAGNRPSAWTDLCSSLFGFQPGSPGTFETPIS